MPISIQYQTPESTVPNEHTSRLRTVTGNRWPRKCACGCSQQIPRSPDTRLVVDFGAARPYPAYLLEHSPDRGRVKAQAPPARSVPVVDPEFVPASKILDGYERKGLIGHADEETTPSPQAGRPWASGQLLFNPGSFESARSGFADYAREGETARELRARVNRVILEDLEQKVMSLRALHAKLRDRGAGESFGDVVGRSRVVGHE